MAHDEVTTEHVQPLRIVRDLNDYALTLTYGMIIDAYLCVVLRDTYLSDTSVSTPQEQGNTRGRTTAALPDALENDQYLLQFSCHTICLVACVDYCPVFGHIFLPTNKNGGGIRKRSQMIDGIAT